jgi:hypothetical protein
MFGLRILEAAVMTLISQQYRIVEDSNVSGLTLEVDAALKAGWKLQGGVSVAYCGNGHTWYAQALVYEVHVVDSGDQT